MVTLVTPGDRRLLMPVCALSLADLAYLGALLSLLLCGDHLPGLFLPH